jgi:hypothetical protein
METDKKILDFDEPRPDPVGNNENYVEHHPNAVTDADKAEHMAYALKSAQVAAIELARTVDKLITTGEPRVRLEGSAHRTLVAGEKSPDIKDGDPREITVKEAEEQVKKYRQLADTRAQEAADKYDMAKDLRAVASGARELRVGE